jgi:hypothetical protein
MTVTAQIKFDQGATHGVAGMALFGVTGTPVVASNGNDANVKRWVWTITDVPPGSSVPIGQVTDGGVATTSFVPDAHGGYLLQLDVYDEFGNKSTDERCFGVQTDSGRFIPPFDADFAALNFSNNKRGWAPFVEAWFNYLDNLPPSRLPFGPVGKLVTPPDVGTFAAVNPPPNWITEPSIATIENHPSGYGVAIYGHQTSAHACFNGVFATRGSNTTLIVQIDAPYWSSLPDGASVCDPFGGIVIYSPANNKSLLYGAYGGPVANVGTGNAAFLFTQDIAGGATLEVARQLVQRNFFPIWLKCFDDGTNYNFSFCFDGEFVNAPTISTGKTAFMADGGTQIGVACGSLQNSGTRAGVKSSALWLGSWDLH